MLVTVDRGMPWLLADQVQSRAAPTTRSGPESLAHGMDVIAELRIGDSAASFSVASCDPAHPLQTTRAVLMQTTSPTSTISANHNPPQPGSD